MKKFLFEKEIRVFGIKRCGNSAIVSFILGHYEDSEVMYLHNTDFSFRTRNRIINPFEFYMNMEKNGPEKYRCFLNTTEHNYPESSSFKVLEEKFKDRNYSYNVDKMWYAHYYGFGKKRFSEDEYNIIILRSPHNNLASILRILEMGRGFQKHIFHNFADDWLMYAREALGETNHFPHRIICLFDKWFNDEEYRKNISKQLGLKYSDKGINSVIRNVGSSFDGFRFQENAQKMDVLNRWKHYVSHDDYLAILRNGELVEKTKILFGVDLNEKMSI